jgi:hypothetical protein
MPWPIPWHRTRHASNEGRVIGLRRLECILQNAQSWNGGRPKLFGNVTQTIFGCELKEVLSGHGLAGAGLTRDQSDCFQKTTFQMLAKSNEAIMLHGFHRVRFVSAFNLPTHEIFTSLPA